MKFKLGNCYRLRDAHGTEYTGVYMGRQEGWDCCICYRGNNAYTFNVYGYKDDSLETVKYNMQEGIYETWGYGKEHLPEIIKDYGSYSNLEREVE